MPQNLIACDRGQSMLFELEAWPEDVSIPAASTMPRNRPQFEGSGPVLVSRRADLAPFDAGAARAYGRAMRDRVRTGMITDFLRDVDDPGETAYACRARPEWSSTDC